MKKYVAGIAEQLQSGIQEVISAKLSLFNSGKSLSLADLLEQMSEEKAKKLLDILKKGKVGANEISQLYEGETSQEATNFRSFMSSHEISYLGGNNSINFKVSSIDGTSDEVLKVDCCMEMPRDAEEYLRDKLGSHFLPKKIARKVAGADDLLVVTEYCLYGDLLHERKKWGEADLVMRTLNFFEQMADILLSIEEQGCLFPDAKLTNWLADGESKLRLGDAKSLLFTDGKGNFSADKAKNFLNTKNFNPPEFSSNALIQADSVHAYIMGKNLYLYFTGKMFPIDQNFNWPKTPESEHVDSIKKLIIGLVKPNPAERIPVREALDQLFMMKNPSFKEVFMELKALKFGSNDEGMNKFIREKQQQINATNGKGKNKILIELQQMVKNLKAGDEMSEVRRIIADFRKSSGFFTIGMKAKAKRIEEAMAKIPVEERIHFLKSKSSGEVMKALASHRYLGKRGNVYLDKHDKIDCKKAATTYKNFHTKFFDTEQKNNNEPPVDKGKELK
ncbi:MULTISPECIES: hypothetical protein [unclassified Legionella]|uniref:hypothetical protein n=1 Tax=unclassified Legionella TaxID=2622702 RepID=UPI0010560AD7|nr:MULTISPECIES: hypothetical protein [unclassified Legionella]MDI9819322.1 hypothetical protein [Legionella sp. PL877]